MFPSPTQRFIVRIRPLAALSVAALSVVLLAGCASASPGASPSPSGSAAGDLCSSAVPSGSASQAIEVEGETGAPATATFTAPLDITSAERTVLVEGDGDPIADGDLVTYGVTIFDATTGEQSAVEGYDPEILPVAVSVGSGADQFFGCATIGSRIVMALPQTQGSTAAVWVLDVLGTTPKTAWGEDQPATAGFPTVELAEDGAPTITIPEGEDAPTETQIAVLKKGDGATVNPGDTVLVQYTGVLWPDGTVFDSSWESGAPAQFATTGVVTGFKKALEGQTVGSQVIAVIPPAEGYGDTAQGEIPAGSTLVFVVDILAAQASAGQ